MKKKSKTNKKCDKFRCASCDDMSLKSGIKYVPFIEGNTDTIAVCKSCAHVMKITGYHTVVSFIKFIESILYAAR